MKLTVMTQITVDGVVQGNGGASDEDRKNGFERGGWARGAGDDETRTLITRTYQRAGAFLFGRRTYALFAGSWGAIEEMRAHPIGVALNQTPRYVASATLTEPRWADTTVLSGDVAATIGELKARPGGELQVHGSGTLVRWLLEKRVTRAPRWAAGRVPAVWPGPVHAGNQKYPGGFRHAGGQRAASGGLVRRYAAKAADHACGLRRCPAVAPGALAGAPRNPSRQRRGSRLVPALGMGLDLTPFL